MLWEVAHNSDIQIKMLREKDKSKDLEYQKN